MKKQTKFDYFSIPILLWIIIIPVIVKIKLFHNPLINVSWYSGSEMLADFFLYYKSLFTTIVGIIMLVLLVYLISQMRRKDSLLSKNNYIFIPLIVYLVLALLSSLFSEYRTFSFHGMPDQFETIWNLLAYGISVLYCYYMIVYRKSENTMMLFVYTGAGIVGIICFLQYFKLDIYRLIYSGQGYEFTFDLGTVYGPFYNINYVGSYVVLLLPLFIMTLLFRKNWIMKVISAILSVILLVSMYGAESLTSWLSLGIIVLFAIVFLLLKNAKEHKVLYVPFVGIIFACILAFIILLPKISNYISATDTELHNLQNIFTNDENVEIDYKEHKLFVSLNEATDFISLEARDEYGNEINLDSSVDEEGYTHYTFTDDPFTGMVLTPTLFSQDPAIYGFSVFIDDKNWAFANDINGDDGYYLYTDWGKYVKLTQDNVSSDISFWENKSLFANGRGYIWNKTFTIMNKYIFLGSGADTFALVYPNDDFVDRYNNCYGNSYITKPHNMYLQITVQTGLISLLCFLIFYVWYFISCIRIYMKMPFNNVLSIFGFAIFLGTVGYMIIGLANDSTITVAPIFWALLGAGIGINYRISHCTT